MDKAIQTFALNREETEFLSILHNKDDCSIFREFLKRGACDENLIFWIEIEMFKKEGLVKSEPDRTNFAQRKSKEIWEKYFKKDAMYALNVDQFTVAKVKKTVFGNKRGSQDEEEGECDVDLVMAKKIALARQELALQKARLEIQLLKQQQQQQQQKKPEETAEAETIEKRNSERKSESDKDSDKERDTESDKDSMSSARDRAEKAEELRCNSGNVQSTAVTFNTREEEEPKKTTDFSKRPMAHSMAAPTSYWGDVVETFDEENDGGVDDDDNCSEKLLQAFDKPQQEIFALMLTDSFVKFQKSTGWADIVKRKMETHTSRKKKSGFFSFLFHGKSTKKMPKSKTKPNLKDKKVMKSSRSTPDMRSAGGIRRTCSEDMFENYFSSKKCD